VAYATPTLLGSRCQKSKRISRRGKENPWKAPSTVHAAGYGADSKGKNKVSGATRDATRFTRIYLGDWRTWKRSRTNPCGNSGLKRVC